MNHLYNLKFDQMRQNDPEKDGGAESVIYYETPSLDRKVCFVQMNGACLSLSYSFLISTEYLPDLSKIVLGFTTHTITMTGLLADKLFESVHQNLPQKIICKDARYNALADAGKVIVNTLEIISNT